MTAKSDQASSTVRRQNFVPTDFVGFVGFLASCFRHEDFICDHGREVFQSGLLRMVQSDG
jgi:hypothetical protein